VIGDREELLETRRLLVEASFALAQMAVGEGAILELPAYMRERTAALATAAYCNVLPLAEVFDAAADGRL
jgi:hypothetical protein